MKNDYQFSETAEDMHANADQDFEQITQDENQNAQENMK